MSAQPPGPGEIMLSITGRDIWEKLTHIEQEITGLPRVVSDHETRIRELESRKTVSPLQLWTVGASAVGAAGALVALVAKLTGG